MKRWRVIITAESPLSLSERKPGGQFRESLAYIPGTVIRGVVAQAILEVAKKDHGCDGVHLADHLKDDSQKRDVCTFYQAFVGPQAVLFENAYVGRLLPATAVSCKAWQGFKTEAEAKCGAADEPEHHGVFDTLIDRLCWEEVAPPGLVYRPVCPMCGGRLDTFSDFYVVQHDGQYKKCTARQRLLTRVALNRRRGVAEDELLYSPSVLAERTFVGSFWGDGAAEAVKRVLDDKTVYLGGGSSRGLGRCQVKVQEISPANDLPDRIARFNKALKGRWELYNRLLPPEKQPWPGNGFFVLDLQSDAILKRDGWLPTIVIDAAMLQEATEVSDDSLKLLRSYAGLGYRGGWQSAWGLPKETEAVAAMGSVYVFRTKDIGKWQTALVDLEAMGIGDRRTEGFGRVRVCDEFHLILREEAK